MPGSPLAPVGVLGDRLRGMFRRKSERGERGPLLSTSSIGVSNANAHCARRHAVRPAPREVGDAVWKLPRQLGHALPDHGAARGTRSGLGPVGVAPRVAHVNRVDTRAHASRVTRTRLAQAHARTTAPPGTTGSHSARRNRALQKIVTTKHALSCHAHTRHTPRHMVNTWFFPRGKARSCTATQHSALSCGMLN